jgi:hypothetical protein
MDLYNSWLYRCWHRLTSIISVIQWMDLYAFFHKGRRYALTEADHQLIKEKLAGYYYIILVNRKAHLTTYLLGFLTLLKTGEWPKYSHVLMNADAMENVEDWDKFKFVEATSVGVHYSSFMEVFDCDSVCLLRPNISKEKWNAVIEGLLKQQGLKYDDLFDLSDYTYVSCVELVLNALKDDPDYAADFPHLVEMIKNIGNLTPQMYRDCPDFKVSLEIRR